MQYSEETSEESLLKPQESEEEPDWNEDYSNEDAYDREIVDEDIEEEADDEGIIW